MGDAMTSHGYAFIAAAGLILGGCGASIGGLTTGSLFGGGKKEAAANVPAPSTPLTRTLQVAGTAARAQKCGYNFDATKLKTQFLAAETAANPVEGAKLNQAYDVSYNGVVKAIASQNGDEYCSEAKTIKIKQALSRHMAGDYEPPPPEPVEEEQGIFGSLTSSNTKEFRQPFPSDSPGPGQ